MISLTVEKRYGAATVRARIAASSFEGALELCKDTRIVDASENARLSTAADPGDATSVSPGKPFARTAA